MTFILCVLVTKNEERKTNEQEEDDKLQEEDENPQEEDDKLMFVRNDKIPINTLSKHGGVSEPVVNALVGLEIKTISQLIMVNILTQSINLI